MCEGGSFNSIEKIKIIIKANQNVKTKRKFKESVVAEFEDS